MQLPAVELHTNPITGSQIRDAVQPRCHLLTARVEPDDRVRTERFDAAHFGRSDALIRRDEANQSIVRLLDDVADAPDRYKMVATLMFFDMQGWKKDEKDLMQISKLMDNSGRRLDLARAGKITQDIQKKIVFRLDEVIKELENQAKSGGT